MSEDEARELMALREERAQWQDREAKYIALVEACVNFLDAWWTTYRNVNEDGVVEDEVDELTRECEEAVAVAKPERREHGFKRTSYLSPSWRAQVDIATRSDIL